MTLERKTDDHLMLTYDEVSSNAVLSDYIIKSPPKEKLNSTLVRWCMRWFVIYQKKASGVCWLFYYHNETAFKEGRQHKGSYIVLHADKLMFYRKH